MTGRAFNKIAAGLHEAVGYSKGYSEAMERAADEIERLRGALQEIEAWSRAYPLEIFPEPDFKKAAELLKAGGITLDAISASSMRHVVEGAGKIARAALEQSAEKS